MKRFLIAVIMLLICFKSVSHAQRLWEIEPHLTDYAAVDNDTSVTHLKSLIQSSDPIRYYAPATLLAYYHSDTERDFLLNTLRIYANLVPSYTGWSDYYRYQLLRGYLGDQGAIAGMDTVARFSNHQSDKLDAIRLLATLGRFDYFGTLQSAVGGKKYLRWLTMDALSLYGQSTLYRDPTRLLLESFIDSAQDHVDISMAVEAMARFDSIRAKDLLKQKYRNSLGSTRHSHFLHLFKFERDSLPEFSIESIMIEPDHFKRELYVPFYADITAGGWSKRYVEPRFVNFVKDWLVQDTSVFVKAQIRRFLEDFIPLVPSSSTSLFTMLDTLVSIKHQVAGYNWVGDSTFVNELDSLLSLARSYLSSGDSNNCARKVKIFQQRVDEEYRDSLDGDTKRITIEGWKFLYYNAQYILARLPVPPPQYQLTLNITGNGTVAKNPDLALYDSATTVTLSAAPSTGYQFSSWSGDITGTANPVAVTMNNNKSITATFTQIIFTITATAGTNGSISPSGSVTVNYGANQTFTITPNACYRVDSVIVDGVNQGGLTSYTFTNVTANHTIRAVFKINTYTITATAGSNGTITPSGNLVVNCGSNQTFTMTPNACYRVDSVIVDGVNQGALTSYTFTNVTANHTIRAVFKIRTYTITASAGTGGTITPSGNVTVNCGANRTFTISASSGYSIDNVVVDGISVSAVSSYTFTNVTANHTISASFRATPPPCQCCITAASSLDGFTLTDAEGKQKMLYIRNANRPYAPGLSDNVIVSQTPAGTLNARFQSGKLVEVVPPNQQNVQILIEVYDAAYPLTMSWTILPENGAQYWLVLPGQAQEKIPMSGTGSREAPPSDAGIILIEAQASQPCEQ